MWIMINTLAMCIGIAGMWTGRDKVDIIGSTMIFCYGTVLLASSLLRG